MDSLRKSSKRGLSLSIQKIKKPYQFANNFQQMFDFTISKQNSNIKLKQKNSLYKSSSFYQQKQKVIKLSASNLRNSLFSSCNTQKNHKQLKQKNLQKDLILGGPQKKINKNNFTSNQSQTFDCLKVIRQNSRSKKAIDNSQMKCLRNISQDNFFQYVPVQQNIVTNCMYNQQYKNSSKIGYSSLRNYHMHAPFYPQQQSKGQIRQDIFPKQQYTSKRKVLMPTNFNGENIEFPIQKQFKNKKSLQNVNSQNFQLTFNQNELHNQNKICVINVIPPMQLKQHEINNQLKRNKQNKQNKQNNQIKNTKVNESNKKRTSIFKDKLGQIQRKLDTLIISAKNTRKQIQTRIQHESIKQ